MWLRAAVPSSEVQCHAGRGSGGQCHCPWVWATPLTVTSCLDLSVLAPVEYRPLSLHAPAPAFHEVLTPVSHPAGGRGWHCGLRCPRAAHPGRGGRSKDSDPWGQEGGLFFPTSGDWLLVGCPRKLARGAAEGCQACGSQGNRMELFQL